MSRPTLLALAGGLFLAGCVAAAPRTELRGQVGAIGFRVEERTEAGTELALRRNAEVDQNSMIRIAFDQEPSQARGASDPRWEVLNDWLAGLDELVAERSALEARASLELSTEAIAPLVQEIVDFDARVDELIDRGTTLMSESPAGQAFLAARASEPPMTNLTALSRFFGSELATLTGNLEEELSGEQAGYVQVSAFANRPGSSPVRLPVRNYDNIEGKDPTVTPLLGLGLSAAERERLTSDLAQAEKARQVLRDLDGRLGVLVERARELVRQLRETFGNVLDHLGAKRDWSGYLTLLRQADRTNLNSEQTAALDALIGLGESLEKLLARQAALEALAREVRGLELDLKRALAELLDGASPLRQAIERAKTELAGLTAELTAAQAATVKAAAATKGLDVRALLELALAAATPDQRQALAAWTGQARAFLDSLAPLVQVLQLGAERLGIDRRELELAFAAVQAGDGISLPRSIDDLVEALVVLGANVEVGDHVSVLVQALAVVNGQAGPPLGGQAERFDFHVTRYGWRRAVTGEAILVRGTAGLGDGKFEPNVAAMASWHHKIRHPSGLGSTWNWFDPGLGIHAASIDLDPQESVEFGLGVQLRLWDGLFFIGVGHDLSVPEDRGYAFVGTSLFKLLGSLAD